MGFGGEGMSLEVGVQAPAARSDSELPTEGLLRGSAGDPVT